MLDLVFETLTENNSWTLFEVQASRNEVLQFHVTPVLANKVERQLRKIHTNLIISAVMIHQPHQKFCTRGVFTQVLREIFFAEKFASFM